MKVQCKTLLCIIMAVLMVRPYYVQLFPIWNTVWAYATLLISIASLGLIVQQNRVRDILVVLAFLGVYVMATVLNHCEYFTSAISTVGQALLAYDLGILYGTRKYHRSATISLNAVITGYLYIDAICVFLGISQRALHIEKTLTFLGYDNYAAFYIIPLIAVKFCLNSRKTGKLTRENYFCWTVCVISKLITQSYAASVALLIFMALYLMAKNFRALRKCINLKSIVLFLILLFMGIYFFNIQKILSLLLDASGKGVELNARTVIWHQIVPRITKVPPVGLGYMDEYIFMEFFEFPHGFSVTHAHNLVLDLLASTGIIGLFLYFRIIFRAKIKRVYLSNPSFRILIIGMVAYFILGFFDAYPFLSGVFLLFGFLKSSIAVDFSQHKPTLPCNKEICA